jgi:hypothetical protein
MSTKSNEISIYAVGILENQSFSEAPWRGAVNEICRRQQLWSIVQQVGGGGGIKLSFSKSHVNGGDNRKAESGEQAVVRTQVGKQFNKSHTAVYFVLEIVSKLGFVEDDPATIGRWLEHRQSEAEMESLVEPRTRTKTSLEYCRLSMGT